jgi:hypothetical protein
MSKALKRICLVITEPRLFFELKPHVTWRLIAFQVDLPVMDWFRRPGSRPDIGISDRRPPGFDIYIERNRTKSSTALKPNILHSSIDSMYYFQLAAISFISKTRSHPNFFHPACYYAVDYSVSTALSWRTESKDRSQLTCSIRPLNYTSGDFIR